MKFYKPDDAPDREPIPRASPTVSLAWTNDTEEFTPDEATEANSTQIEKIDETLTDLQQTLSDHESRQEQAQEHTESVADQVDEVTEKLQEYHQTQTSLAADLTAIQETLDRLESNYEVLDQRGQLLEDRLEQQELELSTVGQRCDRVLAAIFNEKRPCPDCQNGTITQASELLRSPTIKCDTCEYTEEIAVSW